MSKRSYERRVRAKREAQRAARKRAQRMHKFRVWSSVGAAIAIAVVLLIVFLGGGDEIDPTAEPTTSTSPTAAPIAGCTVPTPAPTPNGKTFPKAPANTIDENKIYVATMETSCGVVTITMDPKTAPATVNNFVFLAREGYFDGTKFHRVQNIPNDYAIAQGGDQSGTGSGSPGYQYAGETPAATASYTRGTIAMANSGGPSTNSSQFFFVVRDWPSLPKNYTIFGRAADATSLAALDKMILAEGPELQGGLGLSPNPPIYILKVTIAEQKR